MNEIKFIYLHKETHKNMNYAQLPTEEKRYIVSAEANTIVKQFVTSIKDQIKGARKIVQGVECETLKQFGAEILKYDCEEISTVVFYAGFENFYTNKVMSMADIKRNIDDGKTLHFIQIRYAGNFKPINMRKK